MITNEEHLQLQQKLSENPCVKTLKECGINKERATTLFLRAFEDKEQASEYLETLWVLRDLALQQMGGDYNEKHPSARIAKLANDLIGIIL